MLHVDSATLERPLAEPMAALIVALENVISAHTERWVMLLGFVYVIVALFAPNGLSGLIQSYRKRKAGP